VSGPSGEPPPGRRAAELLFPPLPHRVGPRIDAALSNVAQGRAVAAATRGKDATRRETLAAAFAGEADAHRRAAGAIRRHTLAHLAAYLERFVARARAAGVVVHAARDAAEARAICVAIAREAGARRCVKTKSMATEEIELLAALTEAGVETLETDLGEYVLQLDDDAPSHIVTPMIHKDRGAAGRAFARELGVAYDDDPAALTAVARAQLRRAFESADLGVTGANFLVAETGSIVLCTNEGNGRFTTAAPRVQITVAGIEKVVPDLPSLAPLLELLARSSTGQPLTVYTSILTGPRRDGEVDGPEEVHVVLLDNGRREILADPTFRSALACIRCGACLNACPVYRAIGGHAYGSVYPGPIGAVITPLLRGIASYPELPRLTTLCGACHEACPVDIDLPRLLVALRERQEAAGRSPRRRLHGAVAWALRGRLRYRIATWLARRALRRRAGDDGVVTDAPGALAGWTAGRDLRAPAQRPFRAWWRRRRRRRGGRDDP